MDKQLASSLPASVPGVFDVEVYGPEGSQAPSPSAPSPSAPDSPAPQVLFEIPHGATAAEQYETLRERLRSDLPDGLDGFFHINTDIGAPEVAVASAKYLAEAGIRSVVLRSLVPRTFIDCNRSLDHPGAGAVTPGLPDYIDDDDDRQLLLDLHGRYTAAANAVYEVVCQQEASYAVNLHTFAPRSIALTKIERSIVEDLRAAYLPGMINTWPMRPEVDLITRAADDAMMAPEELRDDLKQRLERTGFEVKENATYRLFHATMGYWHSKRWPDKCLCVEIRRDLLAKEFLPFQPMAICPEKSELLCRPHSGELAPLHLRALNESS